MRSKRESGMQSTDSVAAALAAVVLAATVFKSSLMTVAAVTTPVLQGEPSEQQQMRQTARLQAASACQLLGCCGLCHTGVTCIESEALGCISVGC